MFYGRNANTAMFTNVSLTRGLYGDANWKDKLTAYNGVPITYDAIGNPLNDGTWTYEWQDGRQLKRMTNAATGVTMEFTYNDSGLRTKKVKKVNDVLVETTEYLLNGKSVVGLTHTDHASNEVDKMHFFYDVQGKVIRVDLNGAIYSYIRNLQEDIVGILDDKGKLVVEYKYDAWGKQLFVGGTLASTMGRRNPFLYRGYIYDEMTELYYLRGRYYCSYTMRFVNADKMLSAYCRILGSNMFAYCDNEPIRRIDETGDKWGFIAKFCQKALEVAVAVVKVAKECIDEVFSVAVYAEDNKSNKEECIYGGYEHGVTTTVLVSGCDDKPVVFYKKVATDGSRTYGVNISVKKASLSAEVGNDGINLSVGYDGISVDGTVGLKEVGLGLSKSVSNDRTTATTYGKVFIRPVAVALTLVSVLVTGDIASAMYNPALAMR